MRQSQVLTITIPGEEFFNENTSEFVEVPGQTIQMVHSLLSIAEWETKWKKPLLHRLEHGFETRLMQVDYYKCMTITQNVNHLLWVNLPPDVERQIVDYINDPMTATTFGSTRGKSANRKKIITSEQIYAWMAGNSIPFECEKWHINRLFALIRACSIENAPKDKMGKKATISQNRALNEARRRASGSRG